MNFADQLSNEMNPAFTLNGARTNKSSGSYVLDLFSSGGALRSASEKAIIDKFLLAYKENPDLAMKTLFYLRDVRGGLGERRLFRVITRHMAESNDEDLTYSLDMNFDNIVEFGRWDDLLELVDTDYRDIIADIIYFQLEEDLLSECPSLLAKWMWSENTSSKETRKKATILRKALELYNKKYTPKGYRKVLSTLRKKIKIVESQMSAKKWGDIEYSKVPSKASLKYRGAFRKHDAERYSEYLEAVKNGETKINSSTLYPYEIVGKYLERNGFDETLEVLWDSLPNYCETPENSLAVVDVSGSMYGQPISVAISLGLYMAERNTGAFHNKFITFSESPFLQTIEGRTLQDKVDNMMDADWGMNTDISKVFDVILKTAKTYKTKASDMVKKIYIISDMEFDSCVDNSVTIFDNYKLKYKLSGYSLPEVVFWKVNELSEQVPVTMHETGTYLVSGFSPSLFSMLIGAEKLDPYGFMLKVLNSPRYESIAAE